MKYVSLSLLYGSELYFTHPKTVNFNTEQCMTLCSGVKATHTCTESPEGITALGTLTDARVLPYKGMVQTSRISVLCAVGLLIHTATESLCSSLTGDKLTLSCWMNCALALNAIKKEASTKVWLGFIYQRSAIFAAGQGSTTSSL